jgi:Skp family chaperone for outer membrane proteins
MSVFITTELVEFLANAQEEENQVQWAKLQELAKKKQQTQALLERQRQERIKVIYPTFQVQWNLS